MGKKLGADPYTQPLCRPISDISHVSQNDHHTVRGGWQKAHESWPTEV